jgi:hypothetical protein
MRCGIGSNKGEARKRGSCDIISLAHQREPPVTRFVAPFYDERRDAGRSRASAARQAGHRQRLSGSSRSSGSPGMDAHQHVASPLCTPQRNGAPHRLQNSGVSFGFEGVFIILSSIRAS